MYTHEIPAQMRHLKRSLFYSTIVHTDTDTATALDTDTNAVANAANTKKQVLERVCVCVF